MIWVRKLCFDLLENLMHDSWTPLLAGVVGSTAYGLAGPNSDVDRMTFAAAPTAAFHGLHPPTGKAASHVQTDPDVTVHEVGKAVSLLLSCNPTMNEFLWLDDYELRTPLGDELIGLRESLLSATAVRNAYLGYARSQFTRLKNRQGESFSSNTRNRTSKHARHLMRLCTQARDLWLSGSMTVRLSDPHRYIEFGELVDKEPEKGLQVAESLMAATAMAMDSRPSKLPDRPDEAAAEDWLRRVRRAHYNMEAAA